MAGQPAPLRIRSAAQAAIEGQGVVITEYFSGTGVASQAHALNVRALGPVISAEAATAEGVWQPLAQVSSLTGEAYGFSFDGRTLTFGDATDGYNPAAGTNNLRVTYVPRESMVRPGPQEPLTVTHQDAADATGNGTAATVTGYGGGSFEIVCGTITSATVVFEATQDGTNYDAVQCFDRSGSKGSATQTALTSGLVEIWAIDTSGLVAFRTRISAIVPNSSTLTVTGTYLPYGPAGVDTVTGEVDLVNVGGTALTLGQKAMSASIPVVLPSDQTTFTVTTTGTDAHDAPITGKPTLVGAEYEPQGSLSTVSTAGDITQLKADVNGRVYQAPWSYATATTLTWAGAQIVADDVAPGTDTAHDVRGAQNGIATVQLTTPTVASAAPTFDLSVLASNDGGTVYGTAYHLVAIAAQAENVISVPIQINVAGLTHIKCRLDINVGATEAGEDVTVTVNSVH